MKAGIIILLCLPMVSLTSYAQNAESTVQPDAQQPQDSSRAQYIEQYTDHFFLWPVLKQRSLNFSVQHKGDDGNKITYRPNNPYTLGLGMYLFDLGLEVTFALPINERSKERYGDSDARDLQINALSKNWGADLYYQKYSGFYINDSKLKLKRSDIHPQRADIRTRNYGISGIYIFNHEKFSFRTAFTFSERQIKSKGSFLLAGTINSFKVEGDSSILDDGNQALFGPGAGFKTLKYTTFGISPGYGYNLVYRDFFINATLTLGPAHNWITYQQQDGTVKNDIIVNIYGAFRIGIGYNSDRFFAGLNYVGQSRAVKFEEIEFTNSSGTFRLLLGYRFKEFGVLKKSVWDPKTLFK